MLGPSSWYRIRCDAWERMRAHAHRAAAPLMPRRRWRWHDTRHTFALQLLAYLEQQMDGDEPDAVARRRRHLAYLGGHIKHNPLLIVSRRLGHSSPATTYAYLEYSRRPDERGGGRVRGLDRAGRRHLRRHRPSHARRRVVNADASPRRSPAPVPVGPRAARASADRIGLRVVSAPDRTGTMRAIASRSERISVRGVGRGAGRRMGRATPRSPASRVPRRDSGAGRYATSAPGSTPARRATPPGAGLAKQHPEHRRRCWPSGNAHFPPVSRGSTTPSTLAAMVRALISRRAHHEQRPVTAGLRRLVDGEVGVPWGSTPGSSTNSPARTNAPWSERHGNGSHRLDDRLADRMGGGREGPRTRPSTAGPTSPTCSGVLPPNRSAARNLRQPSHRASGGRRSCGHASIALIGRICRRTGER